MNLRHTFLSIAILFTLPSFGQVHVEITSQEITQILNTLEEANTEKNKFRSADEIQLDSLKSYDLTTGVMMLSYVDLYNYNNNKQISESSSYSVENDQIVSHDMRQTYSYNVDNLLEELTSYYSDDLIPTWKPEAQQRNEYNIQGLVSKQTNCEHDGTQFVCEQELNFEYNANDLVEKVTVLAYEESTMMLEPTFQLRYFYDSMDQDTAIYSYSYDSTTMDWVLAIREVREFSNGLFTEGERLFFEPMSRRWIGIAKEVRTYQAQNLIQVENYDINFATFQYELTTAEQFSYDANDDLTSFGEESYSGGVRVDKDSNALDYDFNIPSADLIVPFEGLQYDIPIFHHKLESGEYFSDADTNKLVHIEHVELIWSNAGTTNTATNHDVQVEVYPNPVQSILTVEVNGNWTPVKYQFFDLLGKMVANSKWEGSQISTSSLSNDAYILEIVGSKGEIVRKNLIKR